MLRGLLTLFIAFQFVNTQAQEWEFGLQGGSSGYMGDLNPENPFAFNDWSAGASAKYNLNHTWGIRGNFAYANTYAYDYLSPIEQRQQRWLGFFGAIKEAAILVDFNFFKWLPQRGRIVYTPYIFAGIGGISFNPMRYFRDSFGDVHKAALRDLQTEYHLTKNPDPYDRYAVSIPFGAGFKYNLRGSWSVGIELGYRLTLSDHLDDVSGIYPSVMSPKAVGLFRDRSNTDITPQVWKLFTYGDSSNALPGTQRGDGRPYDSFMTLGITLSYTIFKGGCPEWQ